MILPKGQTVHENLNTSYTNFDQLLQDLKSNQFTGYVKVSAWQYEGVLFVDMGNLVNVVEEVEGRRRVGMTALESLRNKAKEKDGSVSVYRLEGELVTLVAGSAQRNALYEQLSSDLTSLDRLINKLQKEKVTGHIEVALPEGAGMVFMQNGGILQSYYAANGHSLQGDSALVRIKELSDRGGSFNVYRSDPLASLGQENVRLELIEVWQMVLAAAESGVDRATQDGAFALAFKRACADHADDYAFLDPFAGEFEFKKGHITFTGQTTTATFNKALAQVLQETSGKLPPNGQKAFQPALRGAAQTHGTEMKTWGLTDLLASLIG